MSILQSISEPHARKVANTFLRFTDTIAFPLFSKAPKTFLQPLPDFPNLDHKAYVKKFWLTHS